MVCGFHQQTAFKISSWCYLLFDAILQDDNVLNPQKFDLFNAWLHIVGTSYKNFYYEAQYSLEDSKAAKLRES